MISFWLIRQSDSFVLPRQTLHIVDSMRHAAAFFLAMGLIAAQAAHGGLLMPFLSMPGYALVGLGALCALPSALFSAQRSPWAWPVFALIALVAYLCWRGTVAPDATLAAVDAMLALAAAAMCGGMILGVTRNDARFLFLSICLAGGCVQAVFAVLQLVRETDFTMPYWFSDYLRSVYEGRFPYRGRGLFMNPNQFAWLMNALALMALSVGIWGRLRVGWRIALLYLATMFAVMTVLSASRGGMVSLAAGFATFTILSLAAVVAAPGVRRGVLLAVGLVLLIGCAGVAYAAFSTSWLVQSRFESLLNAEARSGFVEAAIRLFQTQPMFGVGPGMFRYAARLYRTGMVPNDPVYAHDDWVQFPAEYGIVGLAILLLALAVTLVAGVRSFLALVAVAAKDTGSALSSSAGFTVGAVCALVAFAVHANFDFNMHVPANALLAAAMMGVLIGVRPAEISTSRSRVRPVLLAAVLATGAASILLGAILSRRAVGEYEALRADSAIANAEMGPALAHARRGLQYLPDDGGLLGSSGQAALEYESWLQATTTGPMVPADIDDEEPIENEAAAAPEEEAIDGEEAAPSEDGEAEEDETTYEDATVLLSPEESRKYLLEARASYARAARSQPLERDYIIKWGQVEDGLGDARAAREKFATGIRLDPTHAHAWSAYGDHLVFMDEPLLARRYFAIGATLPNGEYCQEQLEAIDSEIADAMEIEAAEGGSQ